MEALPTDQKPHFQNIATCLFLPLADLRRAHLG